MNKAKYLSRLLENAKKSKFSLWKLNFLLDFVIPFNSRHGIIVAEVGEDFIRTKIPFEERNMNHIHGIHACAIATISEFATGLLMMTKLDPSKYRIIMKELKMEYHFQAKMALIAEARMDSESLKREILMPLQSVEKITRTVVAEVHDTKMNHVATGTIAWQIKRWESVKTAS